MTNFTIVLFASKKGMHGDLSDTKSQVVQKGIKYTIDFLVQKAHSQYKRRYITVKVYCQVLPKYAKN